MMYAKTTMVEMERFDSLTVARKYHIRIQADVSSVEQVMDDDLVPRGVYMLKVPGGYANINYGDWIETDLNGSHEVVNDDVFKKAYRPVEVSDLNYPNDD